MSDVIGLADVSSKDTSRGSSLKTGGMRRTYNKRKKKMPSKAKCKLGKVYNQKLKKCVSKPKPLDFKLPSGKVVKTGSAEHKKYIKSKINARPKPINFKLPSGRIVKTGSSEHKKYLKDFYKKN